VSHPAPRMLRTLALLLALSLFGCQGDPALDATMPPDDSGQVRHDPLPLPDLTPAVPYPVKVERGVTITIREGDRERKIIMDVFRPDAPGRFPALLTGIAYRRELFQFLPPTPRTQAARGYAMVLMDVIGTGSSEGPWECFSNREIDDMVHVIDRWIPAQAWSDGKVGVYGLSYMGINSLLAAGRSPEHLKAILPCVSAGDVFRDVFYQHGIFDQLFIGLWASLTINFSLLPSTQILADPASAAQAHRDHVDMIPTVLSWMQNSTDGPFFQERSPMYYWPQIARVPVLATGAWFGIFTRGTLLNYTNLVRETRKLEKTEPNGFFAPKQIVVGPWYHGDGAVALGLPFQRMFERWFDWHLKADQDPHYRDYVFLDPACPVFLYVLGEERWRKEREWPLGRAAYRALYLSSERQVSDRNESLNNGTLLWEDAWSGEGGAAAAGIEPSRMVHDPLQDVSQFPGRYSRSYTRWGQLFPTGQPGAEDERENEKHTLTFSTAPLAEDVEVTGPMLLRLWARSRFDAPVDPPEAWHEVARDTVVNGEAIDVTPLIPWARDTKLHLCVNLNDVFPDGRVRNITSGWLAASYRPDPERPDWTQPGYDPHLYPEHAEPDPPRSGEIYEYVIEVWPSSNVFKKGHQIRLDVATADYPHFLFCLTPSETELLHDAAHPSRLLLPVVPAGATDPAQWIDSPQEFFSGEVPWGDG